VSTFFISFYKFNYKYTTFGELRIIIDEELHVKLFREMYEKYK